MIYYAVNVKNGRRLLDVSKRVQKYNWKEEEKRYAFHKKMKIDQIHKGASDIVKFDRSLEQFAKLYSICLCKIFAVQAN